MAIKDFSIVWHNNQWLTFATTAGPSGWGLAQFNFSDWSHAASAPHTYLDTSPMGPGYRAARKDGGWLDFWVICDTNNCFLFFSDDNGHIYRAQTSLANFPNGFGNTQLIMSDTKNNLFEATNVYKVAGSDQYLLLQEAISNTSGHRYFRSFTSTSLAGNWTPSRPRRTNRSPAATTSPSPAVLDRGHQPRRDGPRRRRPDSDHQSVPTAVRAYRGIGRHRRQALPADPGCRFGRAPAGRHPASRRVPPTVL